MNPEKAACSAQYGMPPSGGSRRWPLPKPVSGTATAASHVAAGECVQETVEQQLHAEVVNAAAKKHRRGLARQDTAASSKVFARQIQHLQLFRDLAERLVVQPPANGRIVQTADGHRRAELAAHRALEQMHLLGAPIINALKLEGRCRWAS